MSKSNKQTYLRLLKRTLEEIARTPKDEPKVFQRLKKKAEKYLILAGGTIKPEK